MSKNNVVLMFVFVVSFSTSFSAAAQGSPLPAKIISSYAGYNLAADAVEHTRTYYVEPMAKAGFNTIDFKLQPTNLDLSDVDQLHRLKALGEMVSDHDMTLMLYVYPHPHSGTRSPEADSDFPSFVNSEGVEFPERFSLIHKKTWRHIFDNAFQVAKVADDTNIAALRFDLETLSSTAVSYDDASWQMFCALQDKLSSVTKPSDRVTALQDSGLLAEYESWYFGQLAEVAIWFREALHELSPKLVLGFMPAHPGNKFYDAFIANLATPDLPAIMDNWSMYNGEGMTSEVLRERDKILALNSNNLVIPWFRVNNYRPLDMAEHAKYAARSHDGYSMWTSLMLDTGREIPPGYELPAEYVASDYYDAFAASNRVIAASANDEKADTLPATMIVPLAYPLDLANIAIPDLMPLGSGQGSARWWTLRDQQVFYVWARSGELISAEIQHLAGRQRPVALQYAVIDAGGAILRNETIAPGAVESFKTSASRTGPHALVVTGGSAGGQAWYRVRVNNPHNGLSLGKGVHFFLVGAQDFYTRAETDSTVQDSLTIRMATGGQIGEISGPAGKATLRDKPVNIVIEAGVSEFVLRKPDALVEGFYTQDFLITKPTGRPVLLFDSPERALQFLP